MENYDITALREWAPLTEVLEKIPSRTQKGIFSSDLNVTCVDVIPEFIALGTDAGIVFWYNRFNGDIQKLRAEVTSPLSCVKIVSSVEYMVAAGSKCGQVSIFQIQKEVPEDLNLIVPLTKSKPIERYTIRDLHKCTVTCCEWSKNGMRLYSGDKQGVVVQTEFDYQTHLSKSSEILNEAYGIVQLNVNQSYLIVSTIYRSIVCRREQNGRWKISQIGKKDRKILSDFGAAFRDTTTTAIKDIKTSRQIVCSRPGLRLWLADIEGNVEQTLLYKDIVASKPVWDIPLLNPSRNPSPKSITNFGKILMYSKNFVITYDDAVLMILNIDSLCVEAIARGFRKILDVTICGREILVLEGTRSLIRISTCPEPPSKTAKIIFNPLLPPPVPGLSLSLFESPIEFEPDDDIIINAEECFELPPIEHIDLDIPIQTNIDSPTTQKNKLLIEQNRRIEVFDKINEMEFDDSILYRSDVGKRHKKTSKTGTKKKSKNGIVEIGQAVKEISTISSPSTSKECEGSFQTEENKTTELTTRPLLMEASFCTESILVPDLRSPDTLKRVLEPKERALAEVLDLEPVSLVEITEEDLKIATQQQSEMPNPLLPVLQYPLSYPFTSVDDAEVQTTPRKKLHFISDDDADECDGIDGNTATAESSNLCDQIGNLMIHSDFSNDNQNRDEKMTKSLQFVQCRLDDEEVSPDVPNIQQFPEFMKIPSLWNDKIENFTTTTKKTTATNTDDQEHSDSQTSGDWEFVDG